MLKSILESDWYSDEDLGAESSSEASRSTLQADCDICLDLEWPCFGSRRDKGNGQRVLHVKYYQLLVFMSKGCPTCTLISHAVSEFSKPILRIDQDFLEVLEQSLIRITLRLGYSLVVSVLGIERELSHDTHYELELYTQVGSPSPQVAFGAAKEVPFQLSIATCTQFIRSHIDFCDKSHKFCLSKISELPTRVLYVGSGKNPTQIRLIENLIDKHLYMTLSHCWGNEEGIIITTTATIGEHLQQIEWSRLPKTIQDAVLITCALKIEYLWIDSLCIIQDDDSDWKAESVKMADVYSKSYLTIAATGVGSSIGGCLFSRWYETPIGIEIPHSISKRHDENAELPSGVKVRYGNSSHEQFSGFKTSGEPLAPLITRAWAFQERILSRRTIHFHNEEMFWECQECISCEC